MNTSNRTSRQAFTLIEMLVVISIIAILASLTFTALSTAVLTSKKNVAGTEARSVAMAIEKFYNDYKYLPVPPADQGYKPGPGGGDFGDEQVQPFTEEESKKIIQTLMAIPEGYNQGHQLNPRKTVYLDLSTPTGDGTLEDPWGNQYRIKMDRDFNNKIEYYSDPIQHTVRAVVVSGGPSGWSGGEPKEPRDVVANVTLPNAKD